MDSRIKVYDNYIDPRDFAKIKPVFLGEDIPWKYCPLVVSESDSLYNFQFVHRIYYYTQGIMSETFETLMPLIKQLRILAIHRIKANLIPKTDENSVTGFHTDIDKSRYLQNEATTAVYYINTNDGGTRFEDGTHIDSVENRICIFPYDMKHSSVTCTDTNIRVVININFFR